jgi:ATP-dependent Clp protease ATP-binding subunit ClpB
MAAIVDIQVLGLRRLLEDRKITLTLDEVAREWLAEAGYDPVYGARPLKRVIQRNLQDKLAGLLLEGSVKDGESLTVTASPDGLEVRQSPPEAAQAEAAQAEAA